MADPILIRAPNHLGDVVMALPALAAAPEADVLVVRSLVPLIEVALGGSSASAGSGRQVISLDRGARGLARAAGELRRRRYAHGVLLTPSFSSALVFVAGGVRHRRGTTTDGRSALLTDRVSAEAVAGLHRAAAYMTLVTGVVPTEPPIPRLVVPDSLRERWLGQVGEVSGPTVGIFPGSHASSRRWDPDRFAAVVRWLAGQGVRVIVFGGPGERELAAEVASGVALDLSGRTDLLLLAAGLEACDLLITNDTGPMHLAAAVGTPTLSIQGPGDPRETAPLGHGHRLLRRADLPCVPCVRNECPRRGRGYVLPEAERECLRLIQVEDVIAAVESRGIPVKTERYCG